jgi:uncharacterized protein YjbI with pentapeptide repeats
MGKENDVPNKEHLERLTSFFGGWDDWRSENPHIIPDLGGADLKGQLLIGKDLRDANLNRANLDSADLRKANLTRARMRNASIYDAHFNDATIEGGDFNGSIIIRSSFDRARMHGVKLRAEIQRTSFQNVVLQGTDLSGVTFHGCDFFNADLTDTDLSGASILDSLLMDTDFARANMDRIDLTRSRLIHAQLADCRIRDARLTNTLLVQVDLTGADITGSEVYGSSVWDVVTNENTRQNGLIVHGPGNPKLVVDDIEVAQFIYLLLRREKIRNVINSITSKAVLILGRFTPERKAVLEALVEELRDHQLLPIVFDFEGPETRDLSETIKVLAGLSLFVIADVSNPRSSPLELQATVPDYQIPFVPIIQEGEEPFAMLDDLKKYSWVLRPVLTYSSIAKLRQGFKSAILDRAWEKHNELQKARTDRMKTQSVEDFIVGDST